MENLGRRTVMGLALGAGGLAVAGCDARSQASTTPTSPGTPSRRQEGVDTPVPRQRFLALRVLDLTPEPSQQQVRRVLADLGSSIDKLTRTDGLTVTVGIGPSVVRAARGNAFPGSSRLPQFAKDRIEGGASDGDVLVQVCADRRKTADHAVDALVAGRAGTALRWAVDGYRGETDGRGARNLLGFYDGVSVPTTPADLDTDVWTGPDDGLTDATIAVVRRIRVDHRRFGLLSVPQQEDAIGRRKKSGAPLSGGTIDSDVDLDAKSASGVYDIPIDAHVRRAHPLVNGAGRLMLRRSYSYRESAVDQGLAFICFQRDIEQFTKTQYSIDDLDALMDFATVTGTGSFLVLPAWTDDAPLGDVLFA